MANHGDIDSAISCKMEERKKFTYRILNESRKPNFDESIRMVIVDGKPLIYYMEKAVDIEVERFSGFTVKYFGGNLRGYLIKAINDVSENYAVDRSYWLIRTEEGRTPVGISHFIPEDGMKVTIELVQEKADEKCE